MFEEKFGIEFDGNDTSSLELESVLDKLNNNEVSKETFGIILQVVKGILKSSGRFEFINKEANTTHYPDIIIRFVANEVSDILKKESKQSIIVSDEHEYGNNISKGNIDLVVLLKGVNNKKNILFITEVKKNSILNKGLLQHCIELQVAYKNNGLNKAVYGVLTCADKWIFTKYDPINSKKHSMQDWQISDTVYMPIPNYVANFHKTHEESLQKVCSYIKAILITAVNDINGVTNANSSQESQ